MKTEYAGASLEEAAKAACEKAYEGLGHMSSEEIGLMIHEEIEKYVNQMWMLEVYSPAFGRTLFFFEDKEDFEEIVERLNFSDFTSLFVTLNRRRRE